MSDDAPPRRKSSGKPGVPFTVLSEAEAEWLVLFGWQARRQLMHDKPPPRDVTTHALSDSENGEKREICAEPLAPGS